LKPYRRPERIAREMHRVLSEIIERDLRDPRLEDLMIIDIELSEDLKYAKVFYTFMKPEETKEMALVKAKGFIRKKIADKMEIKFVPEIIFIRRKL
jgi:ribosome-binding factor A